MSNYYNEATERTLRQVARDYVMSIDDVKKIARRSRDCISFYNNLEKVLKANIDKE